MFALRSNDLDKADECLREAIALDPEHRPSLVAYGVCLMRRDELEQAEVFIQAAVELDPANPTTSALMGLFHDLRAIPGDDEQSKKALKTAGKLFREANPDHLRPNHIEAQGTSVCLFFVVAFALNILSVRPQLFALD
jgi:Flp pilus assembly protein TadD